MAAGTRGVEPEAAKMAALRIIDSWAVAIAALDRPAVAAAQGAALDHRRAVGASLIGLGSGHRTDLNWAGYANAAAIRELDFNDSFFSRDSGHPADTIGPLAAAAEAWRLSGSDLLRGIVVAYEVQVNLIKGIELNRRRIDHVAHLGPAVAAGIGSMLRLDAEVIYHAVNLSVQLSVSTRQTRKGTISSYKGNAPGHVGQIAFLSIDRAMRGETSPAPVYEGDYGILAILLDGPEAVYQVPMPAPGKPVVSILETYPKEHSAGYHGQALIDLALRMRNRIGDESRIRDVAIHTKEKTHMVMGSGAGDREKWDPKATRETLDHSAMYIFTVALQDGHWHHETSYAPERAGRADTVRLWQKVRTVCDPYWSREFSDPAPLDKAHGARIIVTFDDGSILEDELRVPNSHPKGTSPWGIDDYRRKFVSLAKERIEPNEIYRFLELAETLPGKGGSSPVDLSIDAGIRPEGRSRPGLFSH